MLEHTFDLRTGLIHTLAQGIAVGDDHCQLFLQHHIGAMQTLAMRKQTIDQGGNPVDERGILDGGRDGMSHSSRL
ncbi:hypothetical protein Cenrod_0039 [Candidatus Symbiobacter mobilis CR]|uniref:Uncharacterized protein n=1 Tax=Candidatus Symbiobacter mobilis CR TaxID=946483 RepID=U5N7J9_9BURK|nr:hypothetical protein Cenrod_0039 [Candidatus Symbiobacter mobilis CR]